jgi:hypothetical protein
VFALKYVSGFLVTEGFRIPFDQREVTAVVFGVAAGALGIRAGRNVIGTVQTPLRIDARPNLGMAFDALECSFSPASFVAICAVGGAVERNVRLREWARRDLRERGPHDQPCDEDGSGEADFRAIP